MAEWPEWIRYIIMALMFIGFAIGGGLILMTIGVILNWLGIIDIDTPRDEEWKRFQRYEAWRKSQAFPPGANAWAAEQRQNQTGPFGP